MNFAPPPAPLGADRDGLRLNELAGSNGFGTPHSVPVNDAQGDEAVRWQGLVAQVGRDLAEPLTAALERVTTLTTTGRIDRQGLRALREEIDRARQAGLLCQQMARLASGRIRQSHERVHLTHTLQSVLAYRARELHSHGITLTQTLRPAEVRLDASMLFALLNALIDWWIPNTCGSIELQIGQNTWPEHAHLVCRLQHHPSDHPARADLDRVQERLSTLHWHLVEETARAMALPITRTVNGTHAQVTIEFPTTITATLEDVSHAEQSSDFVDSVNSKPLAGSHVLVVSQRRDLRVQVRECLKSMGLVLDFVPSVAEAINFCREGLPHALVFESALSGPKLDQLVASIRREVPEFVFIELLDDGRTFEIAAVSATGMARVGRDAITTALPSALVYELTRVM
ncbi:MAG: hypothetical protein ACK4K3_07840 [Aquabacterium sp.]